MAEPWPGSWRSVAACGQGKRALRPAVPRQQSLARAGQIEGIRWPVVPVLCLHPLQTGAPPHGRRFVFASHDMVARQVCMGQRHSGARPWGEGLQSTLYFVRSMPSCIVVCMREHMGCAHAGTPHMAGSIEPEAPGTLLLSRDTPQVCPVANPDGILYDENGHRARATSPVCICNSVARVCQAGHVMQRDKKEESPVPRDEGPWDEPLAFLRLAHCRFGPKCGRHRLEVAMTPAPSGASKAC